MTRPEARHRGSAIAAAVGAAAGGLSGLFGVGGGILIVPGLVLIRGMGQREAHATSLAAIVPIAVAGAIGYALDGAVDWPAAGLLVAGAAAGTLAGTFLLGRISARGLRILFAAFLLAAAAALPFEVATTGVRVELGGLDVTLLITLGVLAGLLAGLLGVGGGIVMVPGLVLLISVSQVVAKGTSLAVIIPTAMAGSIRNLRAGRVDLRAATVVGAVGAACSFLASLLSLRLDPVLSAVLFAVLLVTMAIRLLLAARGHPVPGER
jgi:uncharacterized membrane protein YfcA